MNVTRVVHAVAGAMVLLSVLLSYTVNHWFIAIAVFVGANLLQSAFTRFCPLAIILRRAGVPEQIAGDSRAF